MTGGVDGGASQRTAGRDGPGDAAEGGHGLRVPGQLPGRTPHDEHPFQTVSARRQADAGYFL